MIKVINNESPGTKTYFQTLLLVNNEFTQFKKHYNKDQYILWVNEQMVIRDRKTLERTTIQSFDVRALQYVRKAYPGITLSYLVENNEGPLQDQLNKLRFMPNIYSPDFTIVNKDIVQQCHEQGVNVIPWTVNTLEGIKALKEMRVDGIISDYPDLFAQVK
jgi:glycerophosphoryl diester phosphodiesterase